MRKIVLFVLLNYVINVFAQQTSVEVTYKVNLLESEVDEILQDIYEISRRNVKSFEFVLLGNAGTSFFYKKEALANEADGEVDIALSITGTKGKYYTDIQKRVVLEQLPAYNEIFVIKHPIHEWKLTKESKKIGKYLCYKATTTFVVDNGKHFEFPVVAWYAPELNLPYGPKNYSGLPGLVLELQEKDRLFYADRINLGDLDKGQLKLIVPPKGRKPISQEEFDAIGAKMANEIFGG